MTGVLAVLFLLAGRSFLADYSRYGVNQEKKAALTRQVSVLKQQQSARVRKERVIAKVNRFVNQATSLGLEKNRWSVYEVSVEESVSVPEMEQILKQCSNAASHYFKPISFHLKSLRGTSGQKGGAGEPVQVAAGAAGIKRGDILLTLRGAFVVRQD